MTQGNIPASFSGANATVVGTAAEWLLLWIRLLQADTGALRPDASDLVRPGQILSVTDGPLQNFEPTVICHEQFDLQHHHVERSLYQVDCWCELLFREVPPKLQSKIQLNYQFRHHSGLGTGPDTPAYNSATDPFAQNALFRPVPNSIHVTRFISRDEFRVAMETDKE